MTTVAIALVAFLLGLFSPALLRRLAKAFPMTKAFDDLSAAVDRAVAASTTVTVASGTSDADLATLTAKLDRAFPAPSANVTAAGGSIE